MKRIVAICGLGLLSCFAQTPAVAQDLKVGFVDIPYVIDRSPTARDASARLEKEFAPKQKALEAMRNEMLQKQETLEKDGLTMSKTQKEELDRDVRTLERRLKRDEQEFREELNIQKNNEFKKVRVAVLQAINQLAKDEGYDLILSEGVLFTSKRLDLTEKVVQYLEKNPAQPAQSP